MVTLDALTLRAHFTLEIINIFQTGPAKQLKQAITSFCTVKDFEKKILKVLTFVPEGGACIKHVVNTILKTLQLLYIAHKNGLKIKQKAIELWATEIVIIT